MSADLFTLDPEPNADDAMREAMIQAHKRDLAILREQDRTPPWQDSDIILQIDEARLLTAIADNCGLIVERTDTGTTVTDVLRMKSTGNAQAVINSCTDKKWIKHGLADGKYVLDLTDEGRYMLDRYEEEKEWM